MLSVSKLIDDLDLFITGAILGKVVYNAITKEPDTSTIASTIPHLNSSKKTIELKLNNRRWFVMPWFLAGFIISIVYSISNDKDKNK